MCRWSQRKKHAEEEIRTVSKNNKGECYDQK